MSATIDHLGAHKRVRFLQDFRDAHGRAHKAGDSAIIRHIDLNWATFDITIEWERGGSREKVLFEHRAQTGPGRGRMHEYFEVEEEQVIMAEYTPEAIARRKSAELRAALPDLVEAPVFDPARYDEAVARVWALAERHRFEDAKEQIRLILQGPDEHAERLLRLAGQLVDLAAAYSVTTDHQLYDWLRHEGISLWYAWGSQATSGGEGSYRASVIRAAEARVPARE